VLAFAAGIAPPGPTSAVDAAFGCFDAALEVINARTPRTDPRDDPDLPYLPATPESGEEPPGDVNAALATAAIAGIARPEREAKRRALLATALLVQERPAAAAAGVRTALARQSDPATLAWFLAVLTEHAGADSAALALSADALTTLAAGPHLAVRAAAHALLRPAPDLPPPGSADPELLKEGPGERLWTPRPIIETSDGDGGAARRFAHEVAGNRLCNAEELLPGLTEAVIRRTTTALEDPGLEARLRRQSRALSHREGGKKVWPDSWLAIDEAVEDALQRAAAGARSADLRRGTPRDPVEREAELADRITDFPRLALAFERRRCPRPLLPPPPDPDDATWESARASRGGDHAYIGATLGASRVTTFEDLDDADGGWRILASAETLRSTAPRHADEPDVTSRRFRAVEIRLDHDQAGLDAPPFADGAIGLWAASMPRPRQLMGTQPLAGLDLDVGAGTDSAQGLGLPGAVVAPGRSLLALLGRVGEAEPFVLDDNDGPLLELRTWRALYESSNYHQPWPRLTGSALVITRRGFRRLVANSPRLVLRDFIDRRHERSLTRFSRHLI
jgi:hypothetical protein